MKTIEDLKEKAKKNWTSDLVPEALNEINRQKWIEAVLKLGEKWILARPVQRN